MKVRQYQRPTKPAQKTIPPNNTGKGQAVRLADVALFGPLMIMSAMNKTPPDWMRFSMAMIGAGTIIYNAHNFLKNAARQ